MKRTATLHLVEKLRGDAPLLFEDRLAAADEIGRLLGLLREAAPYVHRCGKKIFVIGRPQFDRLCQRIDAALVCSHGQPWDDCPDCRH